MKNLKSYTIGIDLGTSGVKVAILDLKTFKLINYASISYNNSSKQDSDMLWKATIEVLGESLKGFSNKGNIKAIGLTGQMHGTVLYDKQNKVIGPIINWQDDSCNRPLKNYSGQTTADLINEKLQNINIDDLGVDRIASGFLGATLFYIRVNDKELFESIEKAVLPVDFIRAKLLGKTDYSTDQTNACSTGLFNTRENNWHYQVIDTLELPHDILPEVHNTYEIAGNISKNISEYLGIDRKIKIIFGGGDNQISLIGSGLISSKSPVLVNIGTGAQISKITDKYSKIPGIDTRSFINSQYAYVGASLGGGESYKWLSDKERLSFKELDNLARNVKNRADGLKFSTGPTRLNPGRNFGFYGNDKNVRITAHRARAIMEGVVEDLIDFYSLIGSYESDYLIGSGNALIKSEVWSQITADMFGKPLMLAAHESTVFGAAVMAAYGIGGIEKIDDALSQISYREIKPGK